MKLEEAIKRLNIIKNYICVDSDEDEENREGINDIEAIETALQALENSIIKDKVKEKLNTVKNRMDYLRKEINKILNEEAGTETELDINEQYICNMEIELEELEITKRILQELLEDK